MSQDKRMSVEKYAAQQRISIYTVIQKINRGELASEVEEIDGKNVTYVLIASKQPLAQKPKEAPESPSETKDEMDYKAAYEALQRELQAMKQQQQE